MVEPNRLYQAGRKGPYGIQTYPANVDFLTAGTAPGQHGMSARGTEVHRLVEDSPRGVEGGGNEARMPG